MILICLVFEYLRLFIQIHALIFLPVRWLGCRHEWRRPFLLVLEQIINALCCSMPSLWRVDHGSWSSGLGVSLQIECVNICRVVIILFSEVLKWMLSLKNPYWCVTAGLIWMYVDIGGCGLKLLWFLLDLLVDCLVLSSYFYCWVLVGLLRWNAI